MRMKEAKDDTTFDSSGKLFAKLHKVPCISAAVLSSWFPDL